MTGSYFPGSYPDDSIIISFQIHFSLENDHPILFLSSFKYCPLVTFSLRTHMCALEGVILPMEMLARSRKFMLDLLILSSSATNLAEGSILQN